MTTGRSRMPPLPAVDDAEFSADGLHRLWLSRRVADEGPVGIVIGLNPSTAGLPPTTDHTITKLKVFTRGWGWSGFWMLNLFTCIETHSWKLKQLHPRGDMLHGQADEVLRYAIAHGDDLVVCWGAGVPKHAQWRVGEVTEMIRERTHQAPPRCFGVTLVGEPLHPLRLAYDTAMCDFELPPPRARRDE